MFVKLSVSSRRREEFIDITQEIQQQLSKADLQEGICLLYIPHTTAALTINEGADPDVQKDILAFLQRIVPREGFQYSHQEGNSDAHIKASLVGTSLQAVIHGGKLVLGTWQRVFFCEFDGPRRRQVYMYLK